MGTLSVVSTPIGNLEDISIRAIKTLFGADSILCEDTRRTGTLMKLLKDKYKDLSPVYPKETYQHFISYYEQNELDRIPQVINALKNGLNIALVSDAGTPAISDPGFKLIRECIKEDIRVESIPGPSSVISALVISGLPTDKFTFVGYPPRKPGHRKNFFENISSSITIFNSTIIMFESPHKIITSLYDMQGVFGDIEIVIVHELTKVHESRLSGRISLLLDHFQKTKPKGEYVILLKLSDS